MRETIALLTVAAGLGACTGLNPAYGEAVEAGSSERGTTDDRRDDTAGETTAETSGAATSGDATSTTDDVATVGGTSSGPGETGAVGPATALLWVSALTMGDWDAHDGNECALAQDDVATICAEPPIELVARSMTPLQALPSVHPFLEEAEFVSARTGEVVLKSFDELLEGRVEPNFVAALVPNDDQLELYAWRGAQDQSVQQHCTDWTSSMGIATAWFFEKDAPEVSLSATAPCMSELRILCTCPARP
ncbi:MAG: hypothetical protein ACE37F_29700 [Nannocystaceae bacterium]|nr:hypothetical protein [bacterium]